MSDLFTVVEAAHAASALRGNMSHHALVLAAMGSHDYTKAIAAALMTLGGTHAPLLCTYDFLALSDPAAEASDLLEEGQFIPGWGNGFIKGDHDPIWQDVRAILEAQYPAWFATIEDVTDVLHGHGKRIFPNPSCYTAVAALITGMPREIVPVILIRGRLQAWTDEYLRVRDHAASFHPVLSA